MISFILMFVAAICGVVSTTPVELQGCYINGEMYQSGEQFMDDCNSCVCGENGLSACTLMACLRTCEYEGQTYEHGEGFMDDCNKCVCRDGVAGCTRKACPTKPESCEYKGTTYEDGNTFMDDCNGCFCSNGVVGCTKMACSNIIAKRTSVPYLPGKCWFNGKFYDIGDRFKDGEDCNTCWCSGQGHNTAVACTQMSCK